MTIIELAAPQWTQKLEETPEWTWIIDVSDDGISYEFYAEVDSLDEAFELMAKLSKCYHVAMYCMERVDND